MFQTSRRRRVIGALTVLVLGTTLAAAVSTPAGAQSTAATAAPRYLEYVALGDSWSADVVFADANGLPDTTYVPIDCAQSHSNYPKQIAAALEIPTFRDATCGSATTDHFWGPQTLPLGGVNPPQFDRLTPTTDLVTVGIGGNDSGFAGDAFSCITPVIDPVLLGGVKLAPSCKDKFTAGGVDKIAQAIAASKPKLVAAIAEIKRRSPNARILMVDYLAGLPRKGCWPTVPIWNVDMIYLHDRFLELNAMVRDAALAGGAEFVNTYTPSLGHHVCTGPFVRYVEGLGLVSLNGPALAVPAHPNQAGANAQAAVVLAKLTS